jgi:hypothetical protein
MGFVRPSFTAWLAICLLGLGPVLAAPATERNLVVMAAKAQPADEPRIALVIGNSDYPQAALANPLNDARAVAERLAALRFATVRIEGDDREGLERLLRYCARPAFALERLREIDPEHLVYESVKPGRGGSVSLILTPLELLDRLAALVRPAQRGPVWLRFARGAGVVRAGTAVGNAVRGPVADPAPRALPQAC